MCVQDQFTQQAVNVRQGVQGFSAVERDSRRDRWFSAEEALAYGFVDRIVATMDDVRPASVRPLGLGVRA